MTTGDTPYTEWTLNPGDTLFTTVGSNGEAYQATMEDITSGRFRLANRAIINSQTGKFAGSLNSNSISSLIVQEDGGILFVNSTDSTGITSYGKQSLVNAASIESTVTLPDGSEVEINVPYANINRIGKQLIVNDTTSENLIYRWADIGQTEFAPGFRAATNREAINYGLSSALIRQFRNVVTSIADAGIEDENGNPIETITDAAAYLVRSLYTSGEYSRIFQLA